MPTPAATDISRLITASGSATQSVAVQGEIGSSPRLTRSGKIQFLLEVTEARLVDQEEGVSTQATLNSQSYNGKLYVTAPLDQKDAILPGQPIRTFGKLYLPKAAANPGGFDFQAYLRQQGVFAGLGAGRVTVVRDRPQSWYSSFQQWSWYVRQQIVKAQVRGAGEREGLLLSAMAIGRSGLEMSFDLKNINAPFELRDRFTQAGLAHALAASGFQVSLLVGVVVTLTQGWSSRVRLALGILILIAYTGLTGAQPAVLRAGIMGVVALIALTQQRKVNPLGSLLVTATMLLLCNPVWIWDLGFQFSFLATLGLLVTVPVLTQKLDWMPPAIASITAVPLAAYLWTLPLQLAVFGVVSPYSVLINVLATPLITVISIGSIVSAVAAVFYAEFGSYLAWLIYLPTHGLVKLAEIGNQLPGNAFSVGAIASVQVITIYGLFILVWWQRWWQRRWWIAGLLSISLIAIPTGYIHTHRLRATILATNSAPVMVIQDHGKVALFNCGSDETVRFAVLPFLQKQGINWIDWAIALNPLQTAWRQIAEAVPIRAIYRSSANPVAANLELPTTTHVLLESQQPLPIGSTQLHLIQSIPPVLQLEVNHQRWLMLEQTDLLAQQALGQTPLNQAQVLWWSGEELLPEILERVQPQVAIASARAIAANTQTWLEAHQVTTYITGQNGAIQWTQRQGFVPVVELNG
jgi:competence protein ComEC